MSTAAIATRLYADDALAPGACVRLGPERAHFLKHVLRLSPGAAVALFNQRDGEYRARIDGIGKGWVSLAVAERVRAPAPEPDLWLVFAPIKRGRIDFLAQHATELGASSLWPVFTRHTVVDRVNVARLQANAIEAAEQCGRLSVPGIREPDTLERAIGAWDAKRRLYVCAERGDALPMAAAAAGHPQGAPAALLTGPEGGFHPSELDALARLPFVVPVGLGPLLLRADTASLAALAIFQAVAGQGRSARPPVADS